ncbi:MAG: hypothetical protein JWN34_505 [Bryobacterales bacterium]|nr:hypothetical protein [Bryobacterales bacterium]
MFEKLPEQFQIYRGAKSWNLSGMSWPLDLHRAVIFARFTITEGCEEELAPDRLGVVMRKPSPRAASCSARTPGTKTKSCFAALKRALSLLRVCSGFPNPEA